MVDPHALDHDAIVSTRPVDVREQLGHADAAHAAAAEAAARQRDRGPDDGAGVGEAGRT